jgi:hypothetical protein
MVPGRAGIPRPSAGFGSGLPTSVSVIERRGVLSDVDQAMVEVRRSSCAPLPAEAATS